MRPSSWLRSQRSFTFPVKMITKKKKIPKIVAIASRLRGNSKSGYLSPVISVFFKPLRASLWCLCRKIVKRTKKPTIQTKSQEIKRHGPQFPETEHPRDCVALFHSSKIFELSAFLALLPDHAPVRVARPMIGFTEKLPRCDCADLQGPQPR